MYNDLILRLINKISYFEGELSRTRVKSEVKDIACTIESLTKAVKNLKESEGK